MATRPVLGGSPISILDGSGKQLEIPLNLLSFGTGGVDASGWPGYVANKPLVDAWLKSLVQRQLLRAGDAPAAAPALLIKARDKGSEGNTITIAFSNVSPPAPAPGDTTVDATVTVTQTWPDLTVASIIEQIGTTATNGSRPGLAILKNATVVLPAVGSGPFVTGASTSWAPGKQDGTAGVAFTLNARNPDDADGVLPRGKISAVNLGAGTFTLELSWQKTALGVKLNKLGDAFAYVITVAAAGSGFAPPAPGLVTLIGGSDATASPATNAQATVLAG
jgi:hypothetical protein